jgi:hypothetical protein
MTTENLKPSAPELHPEWNLPKSAIPPKPGVWPATLALGITFLAWGLVTSLIITGVGIVLFIVAITGWIRDIRHERTKH